MGPYGIGKEIIGKDLWLGLEKGVDNWKKKGLGIKISE